MTMNVMIGRCATPAQLEDACVAMRAGSGVLPEEGSSGPIDAGRR